MALRHARWIISTQHCEMYSNTHWTWVGQHKLEFFDYENVQSFFFGTVVRCKKISDNHSVVQCGEKHKIVAVVKFTSVRNCTVIHQVVFCHFPHNAVHQTGNKSHISRLNNKKRPRPIFVVNGRSLTLKVLVATIDAQWEGMGDVGSARYEPALLPPCPTIRVLSYSN